MATNEGTFPVLALVAVLGSSEIPPAPSGEDYTWDSAHLLGFTDEQRLHGLQLDALNRYNSPLVVVTIGSTKDYNETSIETLARRWFDTWNIGTLGLERGANQGILLIVAVRDRKARIELGADWGHAWDGYAKTIMNEQLVPHFKQDDYPGGILAGAEALVEMAKQGPHSSPPGAFLDSIGGRFNGYSILDPRMFMMMMGVGLLLVLLGIFGPDSTRKICVISGIGLIIFAAFSYVAIVIIVLIAAIFGRRGGGSGSGRGYSGGYSGGGGATGAGDPPEGEREDT